MLSYFAYVLMSLNTNRLYKGHCYDLNARLKQHNAGKTKSTRPFAPWRIIYFEEMSTEKEAIARERYFKTSAGRRFIRKIIAPGSPPVRPDVK